MNILQFIPTLRIGGAEHVASCLSYMFSKPGKISLVSAIGGGFRNYLDSRDVTYKILVPKYRELYLRFFFKPRKNQQVGGCLDSQASFFLDHGYSDVFQKFKKLNAREKYQIINFHTLASVPFFKMAFEDGAKVIYTHHNIITDRHNREDIHFLNQNLKYIDKVICVSNACYKSFMSVVNINPQKVVVLPNPSFLLSNKKSLKSDIKKVGTASSLEEIKGINDLMDVWKELGDEGFDINLIVAGGSRKLVTYWNQFVKDNDIKNVTFLGKVNVEKKMLDFYNSIDMLIIPSITESFSLQASEALSRGIPVLARDIDALREILFDQFMLVDKNNFIRIVDKIKLLIKNRDVYLEKSSFLHCRWEENYSYNVVYEKYKNFYEAI